MKNYLVNGRIYRSHNKKTLARRLFGHIGRWNKTVVDDMAVKLKMITVKRTK